MSPAGNCVRFACAHREALLRENARPCRRAPPGDPAAPLRPGTRGDSHQRHPWEGGMKLIKSKKALVLLGVLAVAVMASVGAYAYFTNNGHGSAGTTAPFGREPSVDQQLERRASTIDSAGIDGARQTVRRSLARRPFRTAVGQTRTRSSRPCRSRFEPASAGSIVHGRDRSGVARGSTRPLVDRRHREVAVARPDFMIGTAAPGGSYTVTGLHETLAPASDGRPADAIELLGDGRDGRHRLQPGRVPEPDARPAGDGKPARRQAHRWGGRCGGRPTTFQPTNQTSREEE